jgi:hypothetical protein
MFDSRCSVLDVRCPIFDFQFSETRRKQKALLDFGLTGLFVILPKNENRTSRIEQRKSNIEN